MRAGQSLYLRQLPQQEAVPDAGDAGRAHLVAQVLPRRQDGHVVLPVALAEPAAGGLLVEHGEGPAHALIG